MARRRTIGENPLDMMIPESSPKEEEKKPKIHKERLTIHLPIDLIERIKNAVYWTPGSTLAGLGEEAFLQVMDQLETERGGTFPPRREELRGGRPLK